MQKSWGQRPPWIRQWGPGDTVIQQQITWVLVSPEWVLLWGVPCECEKGLYGATCELGTAVVRDE